MYGMSNACYYNFCIKGVIIENLNYVLYQVHAFMGDIIEPSYKRADIATIPYKVIAQLAHHPLTDIGLEKFLADWGKMPK